MQNALSTQLLILLIHDSPLQRGAQGTTSGFMNERGVANAPQCRRCTQMCGIERMWVIERRIEQSAKESLSDRCAPPLKAIPGLMGAVRGGPCS